MWTRVYAAHITMQTASNKSCVVHLGGLRKTFGTTELLLLLSLFVKMAKKNVIVHERPMSCCFGFLLLLLLLVISFWMGQKHQRISYFGHPARVHASVRLCALCNHTSYLFT